MNELLIFFLPGMGWVGEHLDALLLRLGEDGMTW